MHRRQAAAGAIIVMILIVLIVLIGGALGDGGVDDAGHDAGTGAIEVAVVEAVPCDRPHTRSGVGTFVADEVVLTAAHVVEGELRDLRVGGSPAVVVGIDARSDLALVALVDRDGSIMELDPPRWIITPHGLVSPGPVRILTPGKSLETGLIRTLTLRVEDVTAGTSTERQALELDALVDEGVSGSPVVDSDGNLLGVIVLRRASTGVSYASAVPALAELLDGALYQEVRDDPLARPGVCT